MNDSRPIARLQSGDIRAAWPHEARSFTPWLFQNLGELGQVVGLRLEPVEAEVPVDTFAADILARNAMDDSLVLIENQLAASDHTHLGQILTYLAGLEARTVIWVATDFREPHLSAVEWLNEHTHDDFSFFAVRVRAVRIGDSPFAALFEVLARPNKWDRRLHATAAVRSGQSDLGRKRLDFWTAFVARVPGERDRAGEPTAASSRWRVLGNLDLILSLYVSASDIGIFVRPLRGGDPVEVRARLLSHQGALEHNLNAKLGDDDAPHFFAATTPGDYKDPAQWDRLIPWLARQADLYEFTLRQTLAEKT